MKKSFLVLAACLPVFLNAGLANANFAEGDLIRVVYQVSPGGTYEAATDLGNAASIMSGGALKANTFNPFSGGYFKGSDPGTLKVAYFATNAAGTELWTSGPKGAHESSVGGKGQSAINQILHTYWAYANEATVAGNIVWYGKANSDSYYYTLNHKWSGSGANPGTGNFGSFYSKANGEATLVSNGSVSQDIFAWTDPTKSLSGLGSQTLTTTVDASGNITTAEASSVPIPPALLLLATGLLGLAAIRKKSIFNF